MWAGLGYYSRGKRLHEGAHKVCAASSLLLISLFGLVCVAACVFLCHTILSVFCFRWCHS